MAIIFSIIACYKPMSIYIMFNINDKAHSAVAIDPNTPNNVTQQPFDGLVLDELVFDLPRSALRILSIL